MNPDLKTILEWVRPARSTSEAAFAHWLIDRLETYGQRPQTDDFGNIWCVNGSTTLFTCHTDTETDVQRNPPPQIVRCQSGVVRLDNPEQGSVLGADNGAGIALILHMIKSGVQTDYVFFREEEIGGHGSAWAAANLDLTRYTHAIAFDRRGTSDVITHQGGVRCCSQMFAEFMAKSLGNNYKPDSSGLFTDTASLAHIIPECTNISVGYDNEHCSAETLDYRHWQWLCQRVTQIDWSALPVVRNPADDFDFCHPSYDERLEAAMCDISENGREAAEWLVQNEPELAVRLLLKAYGQ